MNFKVIITIQCFKRILLLSLTIAVCTACTNSNKEQKILQTDSEDSTSFHPFKHDLFINLQGQLAYRTVDQSEPGKPKQEFLTAKNTDTSDPGQTKELRNVIDTATFVRAGDLYYRDKNHVYYHFQMMDGGPFFIVWEADPKNFAVLNNSYYGKDQSHVFCRGRLINNADAKTFGNIIQPNKDVYAWTAADKTLQYDGCDTVGRVNRK